jgi:hypothetical protein
MLERESQIKELYDLKHINDNELHTGFDYEENLMQRSLSNVMFQNPTTYQFISKTKYLLLNMIESNLIIRNFFNYTVSKYYNRHNN